MAQVAADPGAFCHWLAGAGSVGPDAGWHVPWTWVWRTWPRPFRLAYRRVSNADELYLVLAEGLAASVPRLVEVMIDAEISRAVPLGFWWRVAGAGWRRSS